MIGHRLCYPFVVFRDDEEIDDVAINRLGLSLQGVVVVHSSTSNKVEQQQFSTRYSTGCMFSMPSGSIRFSFARVRNQPINTTAISIYTRSLIGQTTRSETFRMMKLICEELIVGQKIAFRANDCDTR